MAPAGGDTRGTSDRLAFGYTDAQGNPTEDPALAVHGEIADLDDHGRVRRRTRFFLKEEELPSWLPVSEPAMLLWVLVVLIIGWLVVGLVLGLV